MIDPLAALTSPDLHVPGPPSGPDAAWLAGTARWSNGAEHERRRAAVEAVLAPVDPEWARAGAERATAALLRGAPPGPFDVMPAARTVPVGVLAGLLAAVPGAAGDAVAAALFQARDATAALVGGRLLGIAAAPVRWTRRTVVRETTVGGVRLAVGDVVQVHLEPADTFGHGAHACPGRALATALADGVVSAVLPGWRPVEGQTPPDDPATPNLRLPATLHVERRGSVADVVVTQRVVESDPTGGSSA